MNKKVKLTVGILLMVLGLGISFCSVALRHHSRYGMMGPQNRITNRSGAVRGFRFGPRGFNVNPKQNPSTIPGSGQQPPKSGTNQNSGQNSNGGVNQ